MMGRFLWGAVGLLIAASNTAAFARQELKTTKLAAAFGELPAAYDVRMSPDGRKVSYLDGEVDGHTFLAVTDLVTTKTSALVRANFGDFEINSCRWANAERLLCTFSSVEKSGGASRSGW
jgi:hypothetical protein